MTTPSGTPSRLPVELRDGGVLDFGREHALAWYAIWGLGLITDYSVVLAKPTSLQGPDLTGQN